MRAEKGQLLLRKACTLRETRFDVRRRKKGENRGVWENIFIARNGEPLGTDLCAERAGVPAAKRGGGSDENAGHSGPFRKDPAKTRGRRGEVVASGWKVLRKARRIAGAMQPSVKGGKGQPEQEGNKEELKAGRKEKKSRCAFGHRKRGMTRKESRFQPRTSFFFMAGEGVAGADPGGRNTKRG